MTNLETGAVVITLALIPLGFMWWIASRAPIGWQDENGFNYGEPENDK